MNIPVPGMRVIKTALAVFLCLSIVGWLTGEEHSGYSAIVAIVCMQKDLDDSIQISVNRIIGTVIGALFGALTYHLIIYLGIYEAFTLSYMVAALMMIVLMMVIVMMNKQSATAITCIIFLSVAILRDPEVNVWTFTAQRIFDTLVGIVVSLLVNVTLSRENLEGIKRITK